MVPHPDSENHIEKMAISQFLERLSADRPVLPAGGCAAILVGAITAALGLMIARITRRKTESGSEAAALDAVCGELAFLRQRCLDLMAEDMAECRKMLGALALPERTDEERSFKAGELEAGALAAMGAPVALAEFGQGLLQTSVDLLAKAIPAITADVCIMAEMAYACLKSGIWIARANLACIAAPETRRHFGPMLENLSREGARIYGILESRRTDR